MITATEREGQHRYILMVNTEQWIENGGDLENLKEIYRRYEVKYGKKWVTDVKQAVISQYRDRDGDSFNTNLARLWCM